MSVSGDGFFGKSEKPEYGKHSEQAFYKSRF